MKAVRPEDAPSERDIVIPKEGGGVSNIGEAVLRAIGNSQPVEIHAQETNAAWKVRLTYARNLW